METREEFAARQAAVFKERCERVAALTDAEWAVLLPRVWRPETRISHGRNQGWLLEPAMSGYPGWPVMAHHWEIEYAVFEVLEGADAEAKAAALAALDRVGAAEYSARLLAAERAEWLTAGTKAQKCRGIAMSTWAADGKVPNPQNGMSRFQRAGFALAVARVYPSRRMCPARLQGWWDSAQWMLGS